MGVQFVEDLKLYECVEDYVVQLQSFMFIIFIVVKYFFVSEVECDGDCKLEYNLVDNYFLYVEGDERSGFFLRRMVEDMIGWRIGCENDIGEGVYEEVDLEKLDGCKNGFYFWMGDGVDEGEDDGGN